MNKRLLEAREKTFFRNVKPLARAKDQDIGYFRNMVTETWFSDIANKVRTQYTRYNEIPTIDMTESLSLDLIKKVLSVGEKVLSNQPNVAEVTIPGIISSKELLEDLPEAYRTALPRNLFVPSQSDPEKIIMDSGVLRGPIVLDPAVATSDEEKDHVSGLVPKVVIVGDTHGTFEVVDYIFKREGFPCEDRNVYIFNGDYVDRGSFSIEVFITLLAIKIARPRSIYLLRGNHETESVCRSYSLIQELNSKYFGSTVFKTNKDSLSPSTTKVKKGEDALSLFNRLVSCFRHLQLGAVVNRAYFVTHGGISARQDYSIDLINKMNRYREPSDYGNANPNYTLNPSHFDPLQDCLWADPYSGNQTMFNMIRGVSVCFCATDAKAFLKRSGVKHLVRSHTCVANGYEAMHDGTTHTIFSVPQYTEKNLGAYMVLYAPNNHLSTKPDDYIVQKKAAEDDFSFFDEDESQQQQNSADVEEECKTSDNTATDQQQKSPEKTEAKKSVNTSPSDLEEKTDIEVAEKKENKEEADIDCDGKKINLEMDLKENLREMVDLQNSVAPSVVIENPLPNQQLKYLVYPAPIDKTVYSKIKDSELAAYNKKPIEPICFVKQFMTSINAAIENQPFVQQHSVYSNPSDMDQLDVVQFFLTSGNSSVKCDEENNKIKYEQLKNKIIDFINKFPDELDIRPPTKNFFLRWRSSFPQINGYSCRAVAAEQISGATSLKTSVKDNDSKGEKEEKVENNNNNNLNENILGTIDNEPLIPLGEEPDELEELKALEHRAKVKIKIDTNVLTRGKKKTNYKHFYKNFYDYTSDGIFDVPKYTHLVHNIDKYSQYNVDNATRLRQIAGKFHGVALVTNDNKFREAFNLIVQKGITDEVLYDENSGKEEETIADDSSLTWADLDEYSKRIVVPFRACDDEGKAVAVCFDPYEVDIVVISNMLARVSTELNYGVTGTIGSFPAQALTTCIKFPICVSKKSIDEAALQILPNTNLLIMPKDTENDRKNYVGSDAVKKAIEIAQKKDIERYQEAIKKKHFESEKNFEEVVRDYELVDYQLGVFRVSMESLKLCGPNEDAYQRPYLHHKVVQSIIQMALMDKFYINEKERVDCKGIPLPNQPFLKLLEDRRYKDFKDVSMQFSPIVQAEVSLNCGDDISSFVTPPATTVSNDLSQEQSQDLLKFSMKKYEIDRKAMTKSEPEKIVNILLKSRVKKGVSSHKYTESADDYVKLDFFDLSILSQAELLARRGYILPSSNIYDLCKANPKIYTDEVMANFQRSLEQTSGCYNCEDDYEDEDEDEDDEDEGDNDLSNDNDSDEDNENLCLKEDKYFFNNGDLQKLCVSVADDEEDIITSRHSHKLEDNKNDEDKAEKDGHSLTVYEDDEEEEEDEEDGNQTIDTLNSFMYSLFGLDPMVQPRCKAKPVQLKHSKMKPFILGNLKESVAKYGTYCITPVPREGQNFCFKTSHVLPGLEKISTDSLDETRYPYTEYYITPGINEF